MICYWFDFTMSTTTGRVHRSCVDHDLFPADQLAVYLRHPLVLSTDYNLVSSIELIAIRKKIEKKIATLLDFDQIVQYAKVAASELKLWGLKWDAIISERLPPTSIERGSVACALHAALIFLYTTSFKGQSVSTSGNVEAIQLAMLARQSAADFLKVRLLLRKDISIRALTFVAVPRFVSSTRATEARFNLLLLKVSLPVPCISNLILSQLEITSRLCRCCICRPSFA